MPPETLTETTDLIQVEELNPIALFTEGGLDAVLAEIEERVRKQVFDVTTAAGRANIKSWAYKVTRSKTILDDLGKQLNAARRREIDKVDAERRKLRPRLEALAQETRQPLTDWEAEQERIAAEKELARQIDQTWDAAHAEYERREEMARKERELAEREESLRKEKEELERRQAERLAKEEAQRQAQERKERDERIAREAAEKAKREAEEAARAERAAQLELEAQQKRDEEKRIANKRHRAKIEKEAVESFMLLDMAEVSAKRLVKEISQGNVTNVSINY